MEYEYLLLCGRKYLTMNGLNQIRASLGLEPIRPMPGEPIEVYTIRAREVRRDFFEKCWHVLEGFEEASL